MAPNPAIMQAVERLGYRVTVGDVATGTGLNVNLAQQGLLNLASDAGGHLQVAQSGEIVYLFPKNFRAVVRNKFLRLRLQSWWQKVWKVLFYLIRISFGIIILVSIALIVIAITLILASINRDGDTRSDRSDSPNGMTYMPYFWISSDWFWVFSPNYDTRYQQRRERSQLNFFEAVFSFLFGDGNPNANLEDKRFSIIASVIRNNRGAVVAEQIAPYLDDIGEGYAREYEDYMLPVLTRFNGQPTVSPEGQIVYHFPDLQVTASKRHLRGVPDYLEELKYRFSAASSGQIMLSTSLGVLNFVGLLVLGRLLADGTAAASIGGLVAFVQGIYWLLVGYGTAFLVVPLVRYFWNGWRNDKISDRNQQRQQRARLLASAEPFLQQKIAYAHSFAAETVIDEDDLVYTTETDLLDGQAGAYLDAE
jgi:hypothetical protein